MNQKKSTLSVTWFFMPEIFVRLSSKEAKPGSFVSGY